MYIWGVFTSLLIIIIIIHYSFKIKDNKTVCLVISHFFYVDYQKLYRSVHVVASKYSRRLSLSEKHKKYDNLISISFKIVPFHKYTLLTTTVNVLVIFSKPLCEILFRSSGDFLIMSVVLQKHHPINTNFSDGETNTSFSIILDLSFWPHP